MSHDRRSILYATAHVFGTTVAAILADDDQVEKEARAAAAVLLRQAYQCNATRLGALLGGRSRVVANRILDDAVEFFQRGRAFGEKVHEIRALLQAGPEFLEPIIREAQRAARAKFIAAPSFKCEAMPRANKKLAERQRLQDSERRLFRAVRRAYPDMEHGFGKRETA